MSTADRTQMMQVNTALRYSQQLTNLSTIFPLATKAAGAPHREATFPLQIWMMYARWQDILAAPRPGAHAGSIVCNTSMIAVDAIDFGQSSELAAHSSLQVQAQAEPRSAKIA